MRGGRGEEGRQGTVKGWAASICLFVHRTREFFFLFF